MHKVSIPVLAALYPAVTIAQRLTSVLEIEDVFLDRFDDQGRLEEPEHRVLQIDLMGTINGTKLAAHFMKKQHEPGCIIVTGSGKCNQFSTFFLPSQAALRP